MLSPSLRHRWSFEPRDVMSRLAHRYIEQVYQPSYDENEITMKFSMTALGPVRIHLHDLPRATGSGESPLSSRTRARLVGICLPFKPPTISHINPPLTTTNFQFSDRLVLLQAACLLVHYNTLPSVRRRVRGKTSTFNLSSAHKLIFLSACD